MNEEVKLLSGGNPQIPKGEGDEPVQAYIRAMPGWKRQVGERLDQMITREAPGAHKAAKWNQPLYGAQPDRWFLTYRCFTSYVKVSFYEGTSLDPQPPGESKHEGMRHLDIREDDELDEQQFVAWIRQASALPGITL